ncbi:GH36 C-terminal domain-containing protein [Streptococcus criceti]
MAVQFNDDKQVVLTYVRILSTIETMETTLKLKGLDPDATYKLVDEDKSYSGAELMYAGLTMVLPQGDYLSKQLYFVKET